MANFVIVDGIGARQNVSKTDVITTRLIGSTNQTMTDYPYPLGLVVRAVDYGTWSNDGGTYSTNCGAGLFQYVIAGAATAGRGYWGMLKGNSFIALEAANSESRLPVALAAGNLSATNVCGWAQIYGVADYVRGTNTNLAAGQPMYVCAGTTGFLVSNVVNGNNVSGVAVPNSCASATLTAGSGTMQLAFPKIIGLTVTL